MLHGVREIYFLWSLHAALAYHLHAVALNGGLLVHRDDVDAQTQHARC
jgi:hypothetical protein